MGLEGIITIYKPAGWTSHDAVAKVRGILHTRKVGHTGTLDPNATGVLPICLGRATRIMEYLELDVKKYRAAMRFGIDTDTQDIWGTEVSRAEETKINSLTEEDIRAALLSMQGEITQVPSMYSAIKVDGRRLYEYAREGRAVKVPERRVSIYEIRPDQIRAGLGYETSCIFDVACSKGTYVRTLCRDIGEKLGVHGTLTSLERTASGIFSLEDAVTIEDLGEMSQEEILTHIIPLDAPLTHFGKLIAADRDARRLINGLSVEAWNFQYEKEPFENEPDPGDVREDYRRMYRVYDGNGRFIGLVTKEKDRTMHPRKIFQSGGGGN